MNSRSDKFSRDCSEARPDRTHLITDPIRPVLPVVAQCVEDLVQVNGVLGENALEVQILAAQRIDILLSRVFDLEVDWNQ